MIIPLGNKVRAEVIDSVIGQLSDGIWENSGAMNKYWLFADVKGTDLEISEDYSKRYGSSRTIWNGLDGKSETEIKNWFANKAKQVVKIWAEDEGLDPKEIWNRDCTETVDYMGGHDVPNVTVADVYECYDFLKGRSGKKYGRTYEEPIPEEIAPEDDMYEVEDYVEPDVSGGMKPSQQKLEDFFLDASTRIHKRGISANRRNYSRGYIKADYGRFPSMPNEDFEFLVGDIYMYDDVAEAIDSCCESTIVQSPGTDNFTIHGPYEERFDVIDILRDFGLDWDDISNG